jgi:hypothetical protein
MSRLQNAIRTRFAHPLHGKKLAWRSRLRIYCDGGYPAFRWVPRFFRIGYDPAWGLRGFWVSWLGRQFHFSFGRDRNGLYRRSRHTHTTR